MSKLYKTLLVDDDPVCVFLAKMMLEEAGIADQVYTAENGQQALEMILKSCIKDYAGSDACCPELILLDINMPVMDGFEFLENLETRWGLNPEITKIFLLTSSLNPRDTEKARQYRLAGYIQKPLTLDIINKLL